MRKLWLDKSNPYVHNLIDIIKPDYDEWVLMKEESKRNYSKSKAAFRRLICNLWKLGIGSIYVTYKIFFSTFWYAFFEAWTKEVKNEKKTT